MSITRPARIPWTLATLVAILGIGWADFATGPDVGLSLFYLVPIALSGWYLGRLPALSAAVVASAAWFSADVAHHPASFIAISIWNATTRLVIFSAAGYLLDALRRDRDALSALLARADEMASTDNLTGLPNSRALRSALDERRRGSGGDLCLGYVDLDNFKRINDGFGHEAGDDALRRVASAMRAAVRENDVVARVGGDEFVILFDAIASKADAEVVARRVLEGVAGVAADFPGANLGASIGLAMVARDAWKRGVSLADAGMYEAKASGKGLIRWSTMRGDEP